MSSIQENKRSEYVSDAGSAVIPIPIKYLTHTHDDRGFGRQPGLKPTGIPVDLGEYVPNTHAHVHAKF